MTNLYIIPCGAEKADHAAPAAELYAGRMFSHTLACARANLAKDAEPGRILILSAKHGLLELDDVVAPYDCKMGAAGSVTNGELVVQAIAKGVDSDDVRVWALLPVTYFTKLDRALRELDVYATNVYEVNCGIGEQRAINAAIAR